MSTSFLYHAFGLRKQEYLKTEYKEGSVLFYIKTKPSELRCSQCNSYKVNKKGVKTRHFKTVPIGKHKIILVSKLQRLKCRQCGCLMQEEILYADEQKRYTRQLGRYANELCEIMTIKDVANLLGLNWDTVKDIRKEYLTKKYSKIDLKSLKLIAIDEIAIKKGHKYITIVMDLETGAVVFVGDGKGAESLEPFWKKLKHAGSKIEAVSIDMSAAYIEAVTRNLESSKIIFDHFHIVKLMNESITDIRREVYNKETEDGKKKILKGIRWLLLKNQENLNDKYNERHRLEAALQLNKPLMTAYYLKEELKEIWLQDSKQDCEKFLGKWVAKALATDIKELHKFAKTLLSHRYGIFNYYDYQISSGPLEGMNNKIKVLKRKAYGYHDEQFFKLCIFDISRHRYPISI
jgi:transposase